MDISGQHVIITGGASGIGAAVAECCAAAGAKVSLWDMNEEAAKTLADKLGGSAHACNVTDSASVQAALDASTKQHGAPRMLVQCAGILTAKRMVGKEGPADLEHFEKTIMVNLLGSYNVMRLVSTAMTQADPIGKDEERGLIINLASIAAYEGQIGQVAYSASKGGVVGMTLPAARELARFGVRVMSIAPGAVGTPMIRSLPQEAQDSICASIPYPSRFAEPEEIGRLCLHIAENTMLNGSTIRLDGAARLEPK